MSLSARPAAAYCGGMTELTRLRGRTSDPGEADELLLAADGHFGFASDPGAGIRRIV